MGQMLENALEDEREEQLGYSKYDSQDIKYHVADMYDFDVSESYISRITDIRFSLLPKNGRTDH